MSVIIALLLSLKTKIFCSNSRVQIENHLVTQTIELMNHTNRIKSMIDMYNAEMVRRIEYHPFSNDLYKNNVTDILCT